MEATWLVRKEKKVIIVVIIRSNSLEGRHFFINDISDNLTLVQLMDMFEYVNHEVGISRIWILL